MAAVMAERVRWQLDGWLTGRTSHPPGALTHLTLVPDEVVPNQGRQLGFWGGESEPTRRAARALARVQGLLGPEAVQTAHLHGGRDPATRVTLTPGTTPGDPAGPTPGEPGDPRAAAPAPGARPSPSPRPEPEGPAPGRIRAGRAGAGELPTRSAPAPSFPVTPPTDPPASSDPPASLTDPPASSGSRSSGPRLSLFDLIALSGPASSLSGPASTHPIRISWSSGTLLRRNPRSRVSRSAGRCPAVGAG